MPAQAELLEAFEVHSPDRIRELLAAGLSPTALIDGKRPIDILVEMYLRSSRFADCLRVLMESGATIGDPLLESILLDDDTALRRLLSGSGEYLKQKLSLLCAYTSCRGVSPLHVCAEFNSTRCGRILLESGADVNARADVDQDGKGGHTPIFHAVNSNHNYCRPMMEMLVEAGADLDFRVTSLLWGESMSWETVAYEVTPISYAQCGLYCQFHRREQDVYSNIDYLFRRRYNRESRFRNVPNRYLATGH